MRVFISWSGNQSRDLARVICDWLPLVIPNLKPWMSEDDIAKGMRWSEALFSELANTTQGIVPLPSSGLTTSNLTIISPPAPTPGLRWARRCQGCERGWHSRFVRR